MIDKRFLIVLPLLLGGCDSAEKAADAFVDKVETAAREQVQETLGQTLDDLNQKIDTAQQQGRAWLERREDGEQADEASLSGKGAET